MKDSSTEEEPSSPKAKYDVYGGGIYCPHCGRPWDAMFKRGKPVTCLAERCNKVFVIY